MRAMLLCLISVMLLASPSSSVVKSSRPMAIRSVDEAAILALLESYERAFATADADLMQSLFWLDDERFVRIENHISVPFGRDTFLSILERIRENQESGRVMAFRDTRVFLSQRDCGNKRLAAGDWRRRG